MWEGMQEDHHKEEDMEDESMDTRTEQGMNK